jgi:serine/threonine protein kinase/Flp pilus assembly protein TadD
MPADPRRVKELFAAALDLADSQARQSFLERECTGDLELRLRVEALLRAHDRPQPALDQPLAALASAPDANEDDSDVRAGTILAGKYKLIERIGEGGMGSVWMAEQTEPVKRMVAVKLIKSGADSRTILARFEAERQALALMDHPNIARVLDAGVLASRRLPVVSDPTAPSGELPTDYRPLPTVSRPFFVMELVKGIPITKFCDDRKLTPRQRLELFIPVCQAIQHAHQKGVIHRDIKPSNVLVAMYDDRPVPKIIDFGVAKATGHQLTEQTLHTGFGTIIGTPQYMSPEQATFNNLDIDTRSDIYSLGVLLYELLTGSPPFRKRDLERAGVLEFFRVIREEEPPKPSTRLSTAETLPSLAANRSTEPAKLTRMLRGDIDWIVMKALEKDRSRRYETANGFAMDIQRYLVDEPVLAGPPSAAYRLKKFVKRNKTQVAAAALVLGALLLGIVGTTVGLLRADKARQDAVTAQRAEADRADGEREAKLKAQEATKAESAAKKKAQDAAAAEERAKLDAQKAAKAERDAKETAQKRLKQIENGIEILASVFHDLDPKSEEKEGESLRVLLGKHLDQAVKQLEEEAVGDPVVVAQLQSELGGSLRELGHYKQAEVVLTKACRTLEASLPAGHPDAVAAKGKLADLRKSQGKFREAEALYKEVLDVGTAKLTAEHPHILSIRHNLALVYQSEGKLPQAEAIFKDLLEYYTAKRAADDQDALSTKTGLAQLYEAQGKYRQAESLFKNILDAETAKWGADHPYTLYTKNSLATLYQDQGDYALAETLAEEVLEARAVKLGANHPNTLTARNNLAYLYRLQGRNELAETLFKQVLNACLDTLGADHPDTLSTKNNLAELYRSQRKYKPAEKLLKEVLQTSSATLGDEHPHTLKTRNNLAAVIQAEGDYSQAESLFKEVLEVQTANLGARHPDTLTTENNLALLYREQGKLPQAEKLLSEVLEIQSADLGDDHPHTLLARRNLADLYYSEGKYPQAERLYKAAIAGSTARLGADHPETLITKSNLAVMYESQGNYVQSEKLFKEVVEAQSARRGPDHPVTLTAKHNLAFLYRTQKKYAQAETLFNEVLETQTEKLGARHVDTLRTKHNLAGLYHSQGKYPQAETLYEEVVEGRTAELGADHPDTLTSKNDLAIMYWKMKKLERSIPLLEDVCEQRKKKLGAEHPATILALSSLGVNYRDAGRMDDGIRTLEEAVAGLRKYPDPVPDRLAPIPGLLAVTYDLAKLFDKSEPLYRDFLQQGRKQFGDDHPQTALLMAQLGLNLLAQKKYGEAQTVLRECLAIREKKQPDEWGTFNTKSMLGEALLGQKKYADAEPLLKDGYEGVKKREDKIPEPVRKLRLTEALERLVALYEATENKDEAAKWRKALEAVKDAPKQP